MIEEDSDDKNGSSIPAVISWHSNLTELIKLKISNVTDRVFSVEIIFYSGTTTLFST